MHIELAILSGRSPQIKREVSESMLRVLKSIFTTTPELHIQLSVEVRDIERESYTMAEA